VGNGTSFFSKKGNSFLELEVKVNSYLTGAPPLIMREGGENFLFRRRGILGKSLFTAWEYKEGYFSGLPGSTLLLRKEKLPSHRCFVPPLKSVWRGGREGSAAGGDEVRGRGTKAEASVRVQGGLSWERGKSRAKKGRSSRKNHPDVWGGAERRLVPRRGNLTGIPSAARMGGVGEGKLTGNLKSAKSARSAGTSDLREAVKSTSATIRGEKLLKEKRNPSTREEQESKRKPRSLLGRDQRFKEGKTGRDFGSATA